MAEVLWDAWDVAEGLDVSIHQARRALHRWRKAELLSPAGTDSITKALRYRPEDVRAAQKSEQTQRAATA